MQQLFSEIQQAEVFCVQFRSTDEENEKPYLQECLRAHFAGIMIEVLVRQTEFECEGLNKEALAARLEAASFEDLVAMVEELGF